MSLQIRVLVEVCDSATSDESYVRIEQTETVMPVDANGAASDMVALGNAALSRMVGDCGERSAEQLTQMARMLQEAGE